MSEWPKRHVQTVLDEDGNIYPYAWHDQPDEDEAAELFRRCYEEYPVSPGELLMVALGFARMAAAGRRPIDVIEALDEYYKEKFSVYRVAHFFEEMMYPVIELGVYNRQGKRIDKENGNE